MEPGANTAASQARASTFWMAIGVDSSRARVANSLPSTTHISFWNRPFRFLRFSTNALIRSNWTVCEPRPARGDILRITAQVYDLQTLPVGRANPISLSEIDPPPATALLSQGFAGYAWRISYLSPSPRRGHT